MRGLKQTSILLIVLVAIIFLVAGLGGGWWLGHRQNTSSPYPLLDPSVSSPKIQQTLVNFDPLRQDIKNYLTSLNTPHSFYFEYLPNGVNIRDGADSVSVAASLMKTPVVMDLYKLSEQGKLNLEDTVMIQQKDISNDADYGDPSGLQAGQTISLRNAAKLALHDSDNTSINVVKRAATPLVTSDSDAIQSLDIAYTLSGNDPNNKILQISARSYSSILKCLYYSCFLQPKDSTEILNYLIDSRDLNKLAASVSPNVKLAHKIGSGIKAQSDCGIFYQPEKPYLICLMFWDYPNIRGDETDPYFKHVSKMIHDYISNTGSNPM